jgi:hypothetical protein
VPRHRHPRTGRERGPEGDELAPVEDFPRRRDRGATVMRIRCGFPATRSVLDRGSHPGRLQSAHHRRPVPGHDCRVIGERPDAERRVQRIGCHVQDRRVDDVDAHRPRFESYRAPDPLGQVDIIDRPERHVPGERRRPVTEGDELAALLVGGDQERAGTGASFRRALQGRGQLANLARRAHVQVAKQRDPRGRRGAKPLGYPRRHLRTLEREHHPPEDRVRHPLTAPDRPRTK